MVGINPRHEVVVREIVARGAENGLVWWIPIWNGSEPWKPQWKPSPFFSLMTGSVRLARPDYLVRAKTRLLYALPALR